jgi:hypothetical protein
VVIEFFGSTVNVLDIGNTIIFVLAITHTLLAPTLHQYAQNFSQKMGKDLVNRHRNHIFVEFLLLISEVELIIGIWLIPLLFWLVFHVGIEGMAQYIDTREYSYAIYIAVVVVVMSSRPIIDFAEKLLEFVARLGKDSPGAWWWTIMTIGPFLTAILKEPGAMVLSSIVLVDKFYRYRPSRSFQYATMGLLLGNISISGLFSPHSSRSIFFVVEKWGWTTKYMLTYFGYKIFLGVIGANFIYYLMFKHEFKKTFPQKLPRIEKDFLEYPVPIWVTGVNLFFVFLISAFVAHPTLYIAAFFAFLGFSKITNIYQGKAHIKEALYVAFFFAGLVIHGQLQGWWMTPLITSLGDNAIFLFSFVLSGFADNAIVNYLASEIPNINPLRQYLIAAGSMCGGGLTVMSNAPNPAAIRIIKQEFTEEISFLSLFLWGLFPALFHLAVFKVFQIYSF